ncbi:uncharacterized protein DSM5745_10997 [Aspergillus mulundensis]|uniref:Nephrocystin 3-like N-terminal domain-containing protein n=1 Tax=Aspergillus mulundensis TaxID=1810919 RepID=A0A3D8QBT1_9EURO|nr:hypothetical protein DSM5745_10997 [Aspergillus mulundensis]RDW59302.1 hypothetical protein DSM5745_10997 [Aspergillus mulundensis]
MLSSFPSIEFTLMVGIGAGVPKTIDIRLGGVVVSKPTGNIGGVVQYDHGKTMANGRFMHTGSLNRPPQRLLIAVSDLQPEHMMGTNRLPEFHLEAQTKYPAMTDFVLPPAGNFLFRADYNHQEDNLPCYFCDQRNLVIRRPRPSQIPQIHYGLIASGNQVMKDASSRDRVAKEHGIICFEMEAAGLMNSSPCLVIRGICDYADSHKSKEWQGYAGLTAAAHAKELLAVLHIEDMAGDYVRNLEKDSDDNSLVEVSRYESLSLRSEWHIVQRDGVTLYNIFERLSSYDPHRTCRNIWSRKCPDTATWIFSNAFFKGWLAQGGYPCLWITGKIGCGKTFLTSSVIQFLENSPQSSNTLIAHFFYNYGDPTRLKAMDLLESYTKQILGYLARIRKPCPSRISTNLKELYGPGKWPLSPREMIDEVFLPVCRFVPDAIFIVDGLDECDRHHVVQVLDVFRTLVLENKTRILISGREGLDVTQAITGSRTLTIANHGNGSDILRFIDWKIDEKMRDRSLTDNPAMLRNIRQSRLQITENRY